MYVCKYMEDLKLKAKLKLKNTIRFSNLVIPEIKNLTSFIKCD